MSFFVFIWSVGDSRSSLSKSFLQGYQLMQVFWATDTWEKRPAHIGIQITRSWSVFIQNTVFVFAWPVLFCFVLFVCFFSVVLFVCFYFVRVCLVLYFFLFCLFVFLFFHDINRRGNQAVLWDLSKLLLRLLVRKYTQEVYIEILEIPHRRMFLIIKNFEARKTNIQEISNFN